MTKIIPDLVSLLERLSAAIAAVDELEDVAAPPAKRRKFPPAKDSDITTAEKQLAYRLPESYSAFLRIHNGWEGINAGDICVMGVSGPGYKDAKLDFARYLEIVKKEYKREKPGYDAELKARSLSDPKIIYLPDHFPVALNFNGEFWVLDHHRSTSPGEYEVALVKSGRSVEKRYSSFYDFLKDIASRVESDLPAAKRNRLPSAESSKNMQSSVRKVGSKTATKRAARKVKR